MLSKNHIPPPPGFMVTHSSDKDAGQFSSDPRVVNNDLSGYKEARVGQSCKEFACFLCVS